MKVLKSTRDKNTYTLEIEETQENFLKVVNTTFRRIVKEVKVPGFRKGKVSRAIFDKYYGKDYLVQEAMGDAINTAYSEAISELDLKVIDYPKDINIETYDETKPIKFTCAVDVKPEIKLKKYKGIKVKKQSVEVEESVVQERIAQLSERYAEYNLTDDKAKKEDIVRCDVTATINKSVYEHWSRNNFGIKLGLATFGEAFDTNVIGMKAGKEKTFKAAFEDDFSNKDVSGKTVSFSVKVTEVREKALPELTEEFVQKISKSKTKDELEQSIRTELEEKLVKESEEKLQNDILEEILKDINVEIPQTMVDKEVEQSKKYFESTLSRSGMTLEQYLEMSKQSEDAFKKELSQSSEKRVLSELVMEAVIKQEAIAAEEEDLKNEVLSWKMETVSTPEQASDYLNKIDKGVLSENVKKRKAYQFLLENAKISK